MTQQDSSRRPPPSPPSDVTEDEPEVLSAEEPNVSCDSEKAAQETVEARAIADLEHKLHAQDLRLTQTLSQYKAALDDFESTKIRLKRDVARDIAAGKRSLLSDLLEILDNLERALEAAPSDAADAGLKSGVTMVRDQFLLKLEAQGVRRVAALGEIFDPTCFEAISAVPVSDRAQDGIVMGVVRDAYRLGNEPLRTGMVAVGKYKET